MKHGLYGKMLVARIGRIFSNMSIFAAIVCAASFLAGLLAVFYALFMVLFIFAAIVCTLGIILAYYPNIFDLINGDSTQAVIKFLFDNVAPIASIAAMAAGAAALVFLLLGEPKKDKGRIVFSVIVTVLGAFTAIMIFSAVKP